MRIVCISDTHELHRRIEIPDGDVLIHAGDFTGRGSIEAINEFNEWLGELPHKHKVIVPGNHELTFERTPEIVIPLITNAHCLIHQEFIIDGIKFFGSPWTPRFGHWAYNAEDRYHLELLWKQIPLDTQVLITHGPANRIFDSIETFETGVRYAGCSELRKRLNDLKELKAHIFGHIHEGYGSKLLGGIWRVNASICTGSYRPTNKPIVIDI